ncbi:4-hydroxybenzoate octaprenyltransferase [Gammaproteobacteria bacterium]
MFRFLWDRLHQYWLLARFHRPIGIFLLLWPMLWALWIAGKGHPNSEVLFVFLVGSILMRSAGCAINDYADRDLDPFVNRTKDRPLATGHVGPSEAIGMFVVFSLIAFFLVLRMNTLTILLSFFGGFLALSYPFTKRYTHLPQFYLGMAFGWAVPMVFAAQTGKIPVVAWTIFLVAIVWAVVYDTLYAMVDREDDVKIGVRSTAILFGAWDRTIIAVLQIIVIALLEWVGRKVQLGNIYFLGLFLSSGFFFYQQYLIRKREPTRCFQAFLNNHWFGMVLFVSIFLDFLCK